MSTPNEQHQVSPPLSPQQQAHSATSIESIPLVNIPPAIEGQSPSLSLRRYKPEALHLIPCTTDQYLELGHDSEDRYELVDGLLVALPVMDDPEHEYIINLLAALFLLLPDTIQVPVRPYTQMKYLLSPKSKGRGSRDTLRIPDLYLVQKSDLSYTTDISLSPFEGQRCPGWKTARMIFEVTSFNRRTDLETKLEEYRQEKIPEYVIIDRQKGVPDEDRRPCVEVHKLDRRGSYKKKVYYGDQQVDCSYCNHFRLSAKQLLDYKVLGQMYEERKSEHEQKMRRTERAEKGRERAEKEREQYKKRAERAEKGRERAEKGRERAEKEREHVVAYVKGQRKTPPRCLDLDESQLRPQNLSTSRRHPKSPVSASHPKTPASASHPKTPASASHPRSPASASHPRSPASANHPRSPASATHPKSPASPPHRVRKTTHSDVKKSSRKGKGKEK